MPSDAERQRLASFKCHCSKLSEDAQVAGMDFVESDVVMKTRPNMAKRDRGGRGNDNVSGSRAHGADAKSNV